MNTLIASKKRFFFIGIGGIGMSALARYFAHKGMIVAGYDSTPSAITKQLEAEGIAVHYVESIDRIPKEFLSSHSETLVVYTPAVPSSHKQLEYFKEAGYDVLKRAKVLGLVTEGNSTAAVAGTHGKTSTTTMLTHLLATTPQGCNAFLGGISKNFDSNLVLGDKGAKRMVVEADEFDRSFLNLKPHLAIITSVDADHLDIYKTYDEVKAAFRAFVSQINIGGVLILKKEVEHIANHRSDIKVYTYSTTESADFCIENLTNTNGSYSFNLVTPFGTIDNIHLGVLGRYNVENAVAASAAALVWGIEKEQLKEALKTFKGIARRFDIQFKGEKSVYIDDYAHHPEELKAAISSVRELYPNRKITGVFQPHLYSRTNDFSNEFAQSLSLLDELILLDIYPAREEPIPGVTSELILNKVTISSKVLCSLKDVIKCLKARDIDVLITMGAGNIDGVVSSIVELLKEKEKH